MEWKLAPSIAGLLLLSALDGASADSGSDLRGAAERFFRGVYACNPSVVDELAGDDVFITYPIFEKLFDKPILRGRDVVKQFATGFCERWENAAITIHEAIAEADQVVIVWSFRARNVGSPDPDRPPTNQEHSWGGITLYRFDATGKIVAEIGEESEPGPFQRSSAGAETK